MPIAMILSDPLLGVAVGAALTDIGRVKAV
jgi:hypothetical protein